MTPKRLIRLLFRRLTEALFLTELEDSIEVLDPAKTRLVSDTSSGYQASLLYMESCLRQTAPTDEHLYIGHRGAMDLLPFQLDPAIQTLKEPRHRILIADAVGLGKTLEAGILLSELIRRGKGKRILAVAVKSMLTQFQKELWRRFTIPLVRLDSVGIQRVRNRIPTNQNPFYYYDKAIISIDTLKQDAEYRVYLENAYWDVIVIDEAQNVAERGAASSPRSRLGFLSLTSGKEGSAWNTQLYCIQRGKEATGVRSLRFPAVFLRVRTLTHLHIICQCLLPLGYCYKYLSGLLLIRDSQSESIYPTRVCHSILWNPFVSQF